MAKACLLELGQTTLDLFLEIFKGNMLVDILALHLAMDIARGLLPMLNLQ